MPELERKQATAKTAAAALRPYGTFADLQSRRASTTVNSLVDSSFNWESSAQALAKTIPSDVWLTERQGNRRPGRRAGLVR